MSRNLCQLVAWSILAVLTLTGCVSEHPVTVRVLTYNIHHGEGMDGQIDLERIAAVIRETEADLVALQEVDRGVERTSRADQPGHLGELAGMHAVFEKNIAYQGGEYGNAVLSRFPVEHHQNHHLPRLLPNEQRGLLEVHVRAGGHVRERLVSEEFGDRGLRLRRQIVCSDCGGDLVPIAAPAEAGDGQDQHQK